MGVNWYMNKFIFDVDGTLTPSRGLIDLEFKMFFNTFCLTHDVYLVTGSDKPKTVEQISEATYNLAKRVYNCSGCDVYEAGTNVHRSDWTLPEDARDWLNIELDKSKFVLRTGNHIEERPGMVNFSIVGRNATLGERKLYVKWDENNLERKHIAAQFNFRFPKLKAVIGGETGMDIFPKGYDKSQIIRDFDPTDTLHFFGDAMEPTGNDYPLKKVIIDNDLGMCYNVNSWKDTRELLYEKK
jgi:phosphomannomutase